MFTELPDTRPDTPLLDSIDSPEQLRLLATNQLDDLARELRHYMLYSVNQSGGHFGAGLGVVELTIALHYVYNTPSDLLVWDVGHQAYPHKILTGRREQLPSIRQRHGLSAFPKREESPYDTFGVGHSSTSIGAALGMSVANKLLGNGKKTVAIIGDGAMTAGQAFEALTHAGHEHSDMLVVLNDNDMSISHSVGGLNTYFAKLLSSKTYNSMRENSKRLLSNLPPAWELARKTEEHVKGMVVPGTLFEELGFNYIGPIDGHDMDSLVKTLQNMSELEGPQFLHVITKKGRGFLPAEENPIKYHALKPKPKPASRPTSKAEPKAAPKAKLPSYSNVFGQWLCDMAEQDQRLIGITPAMREGSDMIRFSELYPQRYHDVAIAEQHAVTFAAGLACEGAKPVVAIYSTFLQRAYDQLIHDVAIQNLDVLFAIDRAGLVGADGCTHDGSFDLSFLRCIPNMVIMAPSDENQCRQMLYTGYQYSGPAAVRYPRGTGTGATIVEDMQALEMGKAVKLQQTSSEVNKVALLSFGSMLTPAQKAAESLGATLVDMRFIKPLDNKMIEQLAESHDLLVTLEENVISGGAGSGVNEYIAQEGLTCPVLNIGLPDYYIPHGNVEGLHKEIGLDAESIEEKILQRLNKLKSRK